jgi:uncharacterized protein YndB with AHSA1/START domain
MSDKQAEASTTISADPGAVYDLVSDLTQMGRWSPEATGGEWSGDATGPVVGAKFVGNNRSGWRRWSTTSEITAADPGRRFAFQVSAAGAKVSEWSYDFEADGDGTHVVERWSDLRPGWMNLLSRPVMGIADRAAHNQRNMAATLAALKQTAENPQTAS